MKGGIQASGPKIQRLQGVLRSMHACMGAGRALTAVTKRCRGWGSGGKADYHRNPRPCTHMLYMAGGKITLMSIKQGRHVPLIVTASNEKYSVYPLFLLSGVGICIRVARS